MQSHSLRLLQSEQTVWEQPWAGQRGSWAPQSDRGSHLTPPSLALPPGAGNSPNLRPSALRELGEEPAHGEPFAGRTGDEAEGAWPRTRHAVLTQ